MKKYTNLVLIGAIVAGIAGFASLDATSVTSLLTMQGTDMHETGLMIGHVTYEVRGMDGQIKHYFQSDNLITNLGKDCSAAAIFDTDDLVCDTPGNFAFIAIGNATGAQMDATDIALDVSLGDNGGEMDRSGEIDAKIDSASTNGGNTVVTLKTPTETPFTFTGLRTTGTTVTQSGLFDNDGSAIPDNMFAIRDISGGLPVTNTDTLSVTWTITLGSS